MPLRTVLLPLSCLRVCRWRILCTYREWYVGAQGSKSAFARCLASSPVTRGMNDAALDVRVSCSIPSRRRDPSARRGRADALIVFLLFTTSLVALATVSYAGLLPSAASYCWSGAVGALRVGKVGGVVVFHRFQCGGAACGQPGETRRQKRGQ